ncbi:reverse transcriptase domain-containing protein [Tanacetum coccineum]
MLKYAKFMKDLLARKRKTEETSKITLNERCSAVLLNKIPFKEKDPGSFTIPCVIGKMGIDKALADLGAIISLMPYSMYARLDLGEVKPTHMCIELANNSAQYPRGIAENVIVKIDKFIFPVDFVVLDMKEDHKIPIILGRSFLATAHAMIDVFNKKISFEVGNETITFDIEKSMKFPHQKMTIVFLSIWLMKLFWTININLWEEKDDDLDDKSGSSSYHNNWEPNDFIRPTLFAARKSEADTQFFKLKELLSHLEYAFQKFPVIISSLLNPQEKESLLKPQRRLNPKVQDVLKAEIVKLLNSELIYAISDSPWVDIANIDVNAKLPYPTNVKGVRSFLGHAGFYRRFIKDFSKIARPMTQLLMKDAKFVFSNECMKSFNTLKSKLTSAPVIVAPDWNLDFELMCDASDYVVGAVLG